MNIRQEFEAWAIDHGYDLDESKIFGRLYHCDESIRALQVWQAATSRHEVKITNLLNALQSLSRQVERMRESGVVWDDVGPEQMAIEAIAAAKETDLSCAPRGITE